MMNAFPYNQVWKNKSTGDVTSFYRKQYKIAIGEIILSSPIQLIFIAGEISCQNKVILIYVLWKQEFL